jgi:hypothetical protein
MAATTWNPSLIQKLLSPNIAKLEQLGLTEEQQAVYLLGLLVQAAGVTAAVGSTSESASGGAGIVYPFPALTLPMGPAVLNEMLLSTENWGTVTPQLDRQIIAVAAGQTATLVQPVPYGYVVSMMEPASYFATYYNPAITAIMTLDGHSTLVTSFPVNGPGTISAGQYGTLRQSLMLEITNGSPFDTIVTYSAEALYIDAAFYASWNQALLTYGIDAMTDFVSNQIGSLPVAGEETDSDGD